VHLVSSMVSWLHRCLDALGAYGALGAWVRVYVYIYIYIGALVHRVPSVHGCLGALDA
jgi:hypothetical protein